MADSEELSFFDRLLIKIEELGYPSVPLSETEKELQSIERPFVLILTRDEIRFFSINGSMKSWWLFHDFIRINGTLHRYYRCYYPDDSHDGPVAISLMEAERLLECRP